LSFFHPGCRMGKETIICTSAKGMLPCGINPPPPCQLTMGYFRLRAYILSPNGMAFAGERRFFVGVRKPEYKNNLFVMSRRFLSAFLPERIDTARVVQVRNYRVKKMFFGRFNGQTYGSLLQIIRGEKYFL